uniref:Molecular chaperone, HSP90 family n=1 Tax=Candidatus Kentrum sp. FW TaxID=2126338 RepID=A0A450TD94_9GAMM|nr:MAG: Molecular chaperone, HSP90 family [Candidatus Kentron sp. FW]
MSEMQFDFDGLIQLLAGHLYSEKKVFIRELIQNCHDAIARRAATDPNFELAAGRIDIHTDLDADPALIRFRDNGLGMSRADLEDYLSSVGSSGTRDHKEDAPDVIGQFGIGFLSGFVVASRIAVKTRPCHVPTETGWRWENEGRKEYRLEPEEHPAPGTEVTIYLASAEDHGLIRDEHVREVIRAYADMLKVPIYLNHGETPVNQRTMPWERKDISEEERDIDCRVYLEKTMPDSVLEVIPLAERGAVNVSGVLYITRTRVIDWDTPRVLRVFQKRLFLCENTPEILPRWAGFVNGVIDTPDLSPNAARDNFRRDDAFERLRERLGELIIAHFEKLKETNRERLSEILAYHDLAIKAACHYYDVFFEKFGHLLEWRVNSKSPAVPAGARTGGGRRYSPLEAEGDYAWVTLPDLVARLPEPEGDNLKQLNCFTTPASANQFFEMANAAGSTVLDASYHFETPLIKEWAKQHPEVRLVHVDREDDPNVFRDIDPATDGKVQLLANQMSLSIRPGGSGRLRVTARRFKPAELPAVLKSSPESSGASKAQEILSDPNASASLRTMAEEMMHLARGADMRMTINAANPLIRQLAGLEDFEDEEVMDLMGGIYNDAILYNQELMTPSNAKLFHQQFGRLMERSVAYLEQRDRLRALEAERARAITPKRDRNHLVAFYITPFGDEFQPAREAVRQVIEDEFGCQLLTDDDVTYDDLIRGNVRRHIDNANFYIADVTGANPNVMQELGAVHYGRPESPTLLIAGLEAGKTKPEFPADLEGHIACTYPQAAETKAIAKKLSPEFQKNHRLKELLERVGREPYLSPERLQVYTDDLLRRKETYQTLSDKFPTASAWRQVQGQELKKLLGSQADLADVVLNRVLDHLDAGTRKTTH